MKTILAIVLILTSTFANAQLKGSGKTISKTYDYQNFDKIYFKDLDGKIEVEIGEAWSVSITIDDNLLSLLSFEENKKETMLTVYFKGNTNNRRYIENTNINIKITMPEVSVIGHDGNSNLNVKGVVGRYFRLENKSNASTKISGSIDNLDVINSGNGNSNLNELVSKNAKITSKGNGNVYVFVNETLEGKVSGNGSIKNKGVAKFGSNSSKSGNGSLIEK